jgi:hypothetical protein
MDIAAWLCDLDLGQYEAAFRDNDIDAAVLPELTTEDLISIGVTSVGHAANFCPPSPRFALQSRCRI